MSNVSVLVNQSTGVPVTFTKFSDGSETCKLPDTLNTVNVEDVRIMLNVRDCTRDVIRLGLVKDALDRNYDVKEVALTMWYVPQARADRVFEENMGLPIKVFCDIINSYGFSKINIADPHSDVAPALLNNVVVSTQKDVLCTQMYKIKQTMKDFVFCAPDLGATKKIFDSVQFFGHKDYVQGIKIRDVSTGSIVKCDITNPELVKGNNILIVDDIADGGASFKFLAQKLKSYGAKNVGLYVTHGIFSKGLDPLRGDVDYIWCYNFVTDDVTRTDLNKFNRG